MACCSTATSRGDLIVHVEVQTPTKLKREQEELLQKFAHARGEKDGDIHLSINENSDSFKLIISDTGKGMSKETLKKVFEPFISTKSSVYGVGIGLFKAYTIAKVLGGDLEIKSELTVGTEVIITIKKKVSF